MASWTIRASFHRAIYSASFAIILSCKYETLPQRAASIHVGHVGPNRPGARVAGNPLQSTTDGLIIVRNCGRVVPVPGTSPVRQAFQPDINPQHGQADNKPWQPTRDLERRREMSDGKGLNRFSRDGQAGKPDVRFETKPNSSCLFFWNDHPAIDSPFSIWSSTSSKRDRRSRGSTGSIGRPIPA